MTSDFKLIVWTAVSLKNGNIWIKIIILCFVCLIFTRVSYEHKQKVNHNLYKEVNISKRLLQIIQVFSKSLICTMLMKNN